MYRPPLSSLAPYMYEAWYDTIDYAYAYQWFRSHTPVVGGGCSTVRKGNLIGRNLDWTYSESAEFIVHTDGVVGVANAIPGLTDAFVKSGADDEIYKIVPFMLSDGMNKHGLMVSTLVVPTDKGDNSVVRPILNDVVELCTLMLPRYVLDTFWSAEAACLWMRCYAKLYHPKTLQDQRYDQHFVIADSINTYCMEFIDGRYVVQSIHNKPYVTNFHLTGVEFNVDGSVNTPASGKASDNKITPNGSGLERYNMINDAMSDITFGRNAVDMAYLMERLAYTRAYQSSPDPAVPRWDTEFVGNGLTVDSPTSEFDYIQSEAARVYTNRSRILGDTWQTVHSAVYDVQEKKLRLYAQENYDTHWEVSVMADQTHVQHLRGDTAKNDNFTGANGEFTVNTDSHSIRVHDGVMQGGYGTVHATVIDGAYEGMEAPKDLPVGAHVISGPGRLDTAVSIIQEPFILCEFYDFRHPNIKDGFVPRYGSLITDAATKYPKAWAYLQTAEGQLLCKSEAEWQAMSTAIYFTAADGTQEGWNGIGGVPFFVQDLGAGTLRVPDTRGMYAEDAGFGGLSAGGVGNDKMRLITALWGYLYPGSLIADAHGSGYWAAKTPYIQQVYTGAETPSAPGIDTSREVPTGAVVSPRHYGVLPCVYLGA